METTMEALERVRNLQRELDEGRKSASAVFLATRTRLGLTLQQVSAKVRLATATIHNVEQDKYWTIKSAAKLARFYSSRNVAINP